MNGQGVKDITKHGGQLQTSTANISRSDTDAQSEIKLKRSVGLLSSISFIVGSIIGSGIFISPTGVLEGSGSIGLGLINWTICGLIATFGSLSMAELATLIPKSGGEYTYVNVAYGGLVAYMISFTSILMTGPSGLAIVCLTSAQYLLMPFMNDGCPLPTLYPKLLSIVIICFLTWLNCYSVKLATRIQVIFTASKLLAVTIIIIGGLVRIAQGHTETLESGFDGTESNAGIIALGLYNGMWAYEGWTILTYITEEIQDSDKTLPKSIVIGMPLVIVVYLLVNVSYFTVMSVPELLASPTVVITWADAVIPDISWIMPIFVAMSTFGAANGALFSGGRLTHVAAREGHILEVLSMIHVKRYTPSPSIMLTCILAIMMSIPGDIGRLISFFSFTKWIFYGITMAAVVIFRFTMKDSPRPFKVPLVLPIFVCLVSVYLVVAPIINSPQIEFLYAILVMLGGLILYVPFVHFKMVLPGINMFTKLMQLWIQVVVPKSDFD